MHAALASPRLPGWRWFGALLAALVATLLLGVGALAAEGDVQPVPALTDRVIDQADLLSAAQRQALIAKLAQFEQQTGAQIVVLTVPTTAPEDIASYAQRVGDAWKIGRKDVGDGLLLVVAKNDHTVFVATTKALEGAVPDLAAHQIIDGAIVPAFRQGDFAGGLNAGVDQLMARIRGEALPAPAAPPTRHPGGRGGIDLGQLAVFFFIAVPVIGGVLSALLGRRLGSLATAAGAGGIAWVLGAGGLLAVMAGIVALVMVGVLGVGSRGRGLAGGMPIIWGGGGGGGFGGGGGGFSSGGGGDFGGGGASGRW